MLLQQQMQTVHSRGGKTKAKAVGLQLTFIFMIRFLPIIFSINRLVHKMLENIEKCPKILKNTFYNLVQGASR